MGEGYIIFQACLKFVNYYYTIFIKAEKS